VKIPEVKSSKKLQLLLLLLLMLLFVLFVHTSHDLTVVCHSGVHTSCFRSVVHDKTVKKVKLVVTQSGFDCHAEVS